MAWFRRGSMFGDYVPVALKREKAEATALAWAKKENRLPQPVQPKARKMSTTFWGRAWCEHLDQMDTHAARLRRGVTYLRNGSVVDLVIKPKTIQAIVAGSEPYWVLIELAPLPGKKWAALKEKCSRTITSLMDLLAGKLDEATIKILTDPKEGMFPQPSQIKSSCSCPDSATICKHVAATFYGVGCLLDTQPELLFTLRNVDQNELIGIKRLAPALETAIASNDSLGATDLGAVFGIDIDMGDSISPPKKAPKPARTKSKPKSGPEPSPSAHVPLKKTTKRKGSRRTSADRTQPSPLPAKTVAKPVKKSPRTASLPSSKKVPSQTQTQGAKKASPRT